MNSNGISPVNTEKAGCVMGLVSVIVPTFNYAEYITYCIDSVLNQTYRNIEVIVVDDGSTDDTQPILKEYGNRIRCIKKENAGLSAARNTGLDLAKGEYIQFLDSDDILKADSIEKRVACLKDKGADIVVCRNRIFTSIEADHVVTKGSWMLSSKHLDEHLFNFNIAPPHAFMLRRCVTDEVGHFDVSLKACEDYDYWLRALYRGYLPAYCPGTHVYYRQHEKSMSANKRNQYAYDAIMHKRVLEQAGHHLTELPKLAAFTDGLLTTSMRCRQVGLSGEAMDMVSMARDALNRLVDRLPGKMTRISPVTYIYLIKILALRGRVSIIGDNEIETLHNKLLSQYGCLSSMGAMVVILTKMSRYEILRSLRFIYLLCRHKLLAT